MQEESPFSSIMAGAWFATVTIVTVGYGDIVPVTHGGRCVATIAMLGGILVIALPVTVVGSAFQAVYTNMTSFDQSETGKQETDEIAFVCQMQPQVGKMPLGNSSAAAAPARLKNRLELRGGMALLKSTDDGSKALLNARLPSLASIHANASCRTMAKSGGTMALPLAVMLHGGLHFNEEEYLVRSFFQNCTNARLDVALLCAGAAPWCVGASSR
jgi:hypothetical protein